MINSAEEFVRLRNSHEPSEYLRAASESSPTGVWFDVIEKYPEMRSWVAQNKTVPVEVLAILACDSDPAVRFWVAMKNKLTAELFDFLARDVDASVRQGWLATRMYHWLCWPAWLRMPIVQLPKQPECAFNAVGSYEVWGFHWHDNGVGLDFVELVLRTEDVFSIDLPDEECEMVRTVGDLYRLALQKLDLAYVPLRQDMNHEVGVGSSQALRDADSASDQCVGQLFFGHVLKPRQ